MQFPKCRPQSKSEGDCECVFPALPQHVGLFQLRTRRLDDEKHEMVESDIIFAGTPSELWYSIEVKNYAPRWDFLLSVDLPLLIEKTLRYLASISGALAILNMAPVYYLDGEWCVKPFMVLFESWIGRSFARNNEVEDHRDFYVKLILHTMSLLFIANVLLSLCNIPFNRTT